ncbi:MAG: DUF2887 domain-containing protein [Caldilineaceae bacterium]|nr:DUF2887 domain-containing protein [Caldilineaceae bacterium]
MEASIPMKTDALFYELFQAAPQTFFELLQITPTCSYRFESITVKMAEKRIDGVLEPTESDQPLYFLEVRAFPDEVIYWRVMREVSTYFEQRPAQRSTDWQAIVLWLNSEDDPGLGTLLALSHEPQPRLIPTDLITLLKRLNEDSLVLQVLRPLLIDNESEVRQNVVQWVETIRRTPNMDTQTEERLVAILSQLIEQKFKNLGYKELSEMLRLTPLRETASFQEVFKEEWLDVLLPMIRRQFVISEEIQDALHRDLALLDADSLKALIPILQELNRVEDLERWIAEHHPHTLA